MLLRLTLRGLMPGAALAVALVAPRPGWAQTPPPAAAPAAPMVAAPAQPGDVFGEGKVLVAKPIVYVKGSGTWDKTLPTIAGAFRKLKTYLDKEGLKPDGQPMTIFTSTDDIGFQYQAEIPLAEPPKNVPRGDIYGGLSPEGNALKFVHRGPNEALDDTYEAITNYLDDKRIEYKDMFIEEYVTDPVTADEKNLVVNIYVLLK